MSALSLSLDAMRFITTDSLVWKADMMAAYEACVWPSESFSRAMSSQASAIRFLSAASRGWMRRISFSTVSASAASPPSNRILAIVLR